MQRFYCDWCGAEQPRITNLDSWSLVLQHCGTSKAHICFEICDACARSTHLHEQRDGNSGIVLTIDVLENIVNRLRERAKSPQRAAATKENST